MRRSFLKHRQRGFSLAEIIIALCIGSVIILFSGNLIVNSKIQETKASITSEVDRIHLINLQRSRNPNFLIAQNLIFGGLTPAQKQNAERCMTGKVPAGGCTGFDQAANAATVFNDETPSQYFVSTISARRICDARGCHKIEIQVRTGDRNPNDQYDIFERKSVGYLPAFSFASNSDMDVSCGAEVMGAFNYYQMQPQCGSLPGNFQCNNGDRIMNVGFGAAMVDPSLCAGMAQRNCTAANQYGLNVTGVLSNQQFCQGPGATIGSSCVPVWMPRPEDMCAGVGYVQYDGCGNSRNVIGTGDCSATIYPSTTASGPYTPPSFSTTTRPPTTSTGATTSTSTSTTSPSGFCSGRVLFPYASAPPAPNCVMAPLPDSCMNPCAVDGQVLQHPYGGCGNAACVCNCLGGPTTTTLAPTTTTGAGPTTTSPGACVSVPLVRTTCFAGGTQISMADGTKKSIENVLIGDRVQIFDEELGIRSESIVTETLHHPAKRQIMYTFKLSNGSQFKVTAEHLLYTTDRGYVPAVWLQNDFIKSKSVKLLDERSRIAEVTSVLATDESIPTYNLHVQGIAERDREGTRNGRGHNYFANGILAHNRKCCGIPCTSDGVTQPYPIYGTGIMCYSSNIRSEPENIDQCDPSQSSMIQVCVDGSGSRVGNSQCSSGGGGTCPEECPQYEQGGACSSTPVSGGCQVYCSGTGNIFYRCQ